MKQRYYTPNYQECFARRNFLKENRRTILSLKETVVLLLRPTISDGTAKLDDYIEECHAQQNRTGDAGGEDAALKQHFIAFGNILGIVAQSCQGISIFAIQCHHRHPKGQYNAYGDSPTKQVPFKRLIIHNPVFNQ